MGRLSGVLSHDPTISRTNAAAIRLGNFFIVLVFRLIENTNVKINQKWEKIDQTLKKITTDKITF